MSLNPSKCLPKLAVGSAVCLLVACGDTTEVTQINQSGVEVVSSVKDLPKCTSDNKGEQVLVTDEATIRVCVDGEWFATKSGGEGDFSCKTEELKDKSGLKIVCNGDSIGVVLNGSDGKDGKQGKDGQKGDDGASGTGCSIADRTDSTVTVVCGDSTMVMGLGGGSGDVLELDSERVAVSLDSLAGYSQKGPFLKGSTVYLYELTDGRTLKQTNGNFTSIITRDDGRYKFTARDLASQYAMIVAEGYYRNEVTGTSSNASIRLRALTDMRKRSSANVNLLTHLEFDRVYYLVTRGDATGKKLTVKQAKRQAQNEIFSAFFIDTTDVKVSAEDLDVFGKTDADAALLAISILLQGGGNATDLSVLLTEIANDMEADGKWDGPTSDSLKAQIALWAVSADAMGQLGDFRKHVSDWNLSDTVPQFEKFIRNFYSTVAGLGTCGEASIPVGTVKYFTNPKSAIYAKDYDDTTKTKIRFICANADSARWRFAKNIEKDTVGWGMGTGTGNHYTYAVRPGRINKDFFYYKEEMEDAWRDASVLEYDTYDYENNKPWEAYEGDIRTGSVTNSIVYVYMEAAGQMKWRVADIIESQLGGCIVRRDSIGYARAVCRSGGTYVSCGPEQVNLDYFKEGYYICKNTDEQDYTKWEWVLAKDLESDTHGMECFEDGRLVDGKADSTNKYVCDNGEFRAATKKEIEFGLGCVSYNALQFISVTGKLFRCDWQEGWIIADEIYGSTKDGFWKGDDGTVYSVAWIDTLLWMSKNLDREVGVDGSTLTCRVLSEYDSDYLSNYGCLYSWEDAMKACPAGWRLSSNEDWDALIIFAGGYNSTGFENLRSQDWSNGASSYKNGFDVLPGGYYDGQSYNGYGSSAYFWVYAESSEKMGRVVFDSAEEDKISQGYTQNTDNAYSIRCVLDNSSVVEDNGGQGE